MRRHTLVALGLAVMVSSSSLLLGGCEGDAPVPSPSVSPPSSSAVSPSESTSPSVKAESAEEFIRRWIDLHTEMQNTGDTAEFRKLSKRCEPCIGLADQVDQIYADGGFVETDGWTPTRIKQTSRRGARRYFEVDIDNAETRYAESAGGDVKTIPSGQPIILLDLLRTPKGLVVTSLAQKSKP